MKRLIVVLALLLAFPCTGFAADAFCGVDTDRNSSVDLACGAIFDGGACTDNDSDHYCSSADPDDNDPLMFPDVALGITGGCSAGQVKIAQTGGYSACVDPCPSDCSIGCKYVDPVSGNNANNGDLATPWQTAAMWGSSVPSPPGGAITPGSKCIGYLGGTITYSYSAGGYNRMFFLDSVSGSSSANPIRIFCVPGQSCVIDASTTPTSPITILSSSHVRVSGFEVTGNRCVTNNDYGCVAINGSTDVIGYALKVHDNEGDGDSNFSGLYVNVSTDSGFHHSLAWNNTQYTGNSNNTTNLLWYRGDGNIFEDLWLWYTTAGNPKGAKQKHSGYTSDTIFRRIHSHNGSVEVSGPNFNADNILIVNRGFNFGDLGGDNYTTNNSVSYTTILDTHPLLMTVRKAKNQNGTSAADICSGNWTVSSLSFDHNVWTDTDSLYSITDVEDRFMNINAYMPDGLYTEVAAALSFSDNIYYNPNAAINLGIHEQNDGNSPCTENDSGSSGAKYTFSTWKSTAGKDTSGSYEENPSLSGTLTYKAGAAHAAGKGWNENWNGVTGGATPTPTPTATPTSAPVALRKGQSSGGNI